jgi:hypothetical protein
MQEISIASGGAIAPKPRVPDEIEACGKRFLAQRPAFFAWSGT